MKTIVQVFLMFVIIYLLTVHVIPL